MLQQYTIKFLTQLKNNNNKPWFEANRSSYENAKADFYLLVEKLITGISKFDEDIQTLQVKDCVFRQYRDIRFSKDKKPYKTNMGAYFNAGGKKKNTAGYYLHVEPGKSFVAGGLYQPEAALLAQVRQEIDYNFTEWKSIIQSASFKKSFPAGLSQDDRISRPPKGYDTQNPAIEYLKNKSFTVSDSLSDKMLTDPSLLKNLLSHFKTIKPMLDFLNRSAV